MLSGKLIKLRAVEPEDLDLMYEIENDTSLWECGVATVPFSRYVLKQYLEQSSVDFYRDGQVRFTIETLDEGCAIGFADLQNYDARHQRAEIGVVLLPAWQGRGMGAEAMKLLGTYASDFLHLHQIYAYVEASNTKVQHLVTSIGYEKTATLPDWLCSAEGWQPVYLFQLIF